MDIGQVLISFIDNETELKDCGTVIKNSVKLTFDECFERLRNRTVGDADTDRFKVDSVIDYLHDELNTGHWSNVSLDVRKLFTVCSFLKAYLILQATEELVRFKDALRTTDLGLLLGAPLDDNPELLLKTASFLTSKINRGSEVGTCRDKISNKKRKISHLNSFNVENSKEVIMLQCPSLETFYKDFYKTQIPVKLLGCMDHWTAVNKWKDMNYLLSVAGERTVPIELGPHYADQNWGQKLMTLRDFIENHLIKESEQLGYLAQHNLFDQVAELRADIHVPEYCCVGGSEPDINAWLGPAGTVSPLHHDPKDNMLTQVFGSKRVLLFAESDTPWLYPHEEHLLNNTARVDPLQPDLETYPLFANASPLQCLLGAGEMLYIPAHTWHHVTALSRSFSVSFWWK